MANPTAESLRQRLLFIGMAGMVASLFFSRAGLSLFMFLFVAASLLHKDCWQQVRKAFQNWLLLGMCLLFFIPFVSGLWSSNVQEWSSVVRIKLPLLMLPIAFAGSWQLPQRRWLQLAFLFLAFLLAGTWWSTFYYLQNLAEVHESYLKAKTLLTPLHNDHVRFSWLVAAGALLCALLLQMQKRLKILLILLIAWFAVYLHLLSARTGLFSFYIMLGGYAIWYMVQQKNVSKSFWLLGLLLALPLMAYFTLPTFQNRIRYFIYDYSFIKSGAYLPGANDGARAQSYKAGWHLLQKHPLGVGAGDVKGEANSWYTQNIHHMVETDKLLPSSEWLLYGGFAGWPGLLLFTLAMLLPLYFAPPQHRIYWWLITGTLALSFLADVGLEVQYGVFIYSFFVLWWWKWFHAPQQNTVA
ncbi:MAG: hypothetical protein ACO1NX_05970 [Chitinophagaceae bacterium]